MANENNGRNGKFNQAISNGLVATIGWGALLVIYVVFRVFKIEAPAIDQAFLMLTGGWVGMLTLAQGKKAQKAEDDIAILKKVASEDHPEKKELSSDDDG